MLALIEIPHQRPVRINWYDDDEALITAAEEHAKERCQLPIERHGCDYQVNNAAHELADDWNGIILVRSVKDVDAVRNYTGHQKNRVRAMVDELEVEFPT